MRQKIMILATVVAVLAAVGAGLYEWHQFSERPTHPELLLIENADPMVALKAELQLGNIHFIGTLGIIALPGIKGEDEKYGDTFGRRYIDGMREHGNDEHDRLWSIAYNYAEEYNRALLKEIKDKGLKPDMRDLGGGIHPLHLEINKQKTPAPAKAP